MQRDKDLFMLEKEREYSEAIAEELNKIEMDKVKNHAIVT